MFSKWSRLNVLNSEDAPVLGSASVSSTQHGSAQNSPPSPLQFWPTVSPVRLWFYVANVSIRNTGHFPFFLLTEDNKMSQVMGASLSLLEQDNPKAITVFKCLWLSDALAELISHFWDGRQCPSPAESHPNCTSQCMT